MDLVAEHLSPERAKAFRAMGLDVVQGRREGVRIHDLDGNVYINCRSSGGVFNFGHRPQFAIRALQRALEETGDMGDWLVPSVARARGASALARILPGDLQYVFFTPGGGEAIEVACKLARAVTGRTGIVSAEHGYHGHVGFALAMDEARDTHWFAPLVPGIVKVPFGDLDAVARAVTEDTAAVCMETIPATAGYLVPDDDFWPSVHAICRERGALLVLDEVQSGLGRTGTIWACEHWNVVPDLLVTGKGLSGGVYPIAACCFGERVDPFFAQDPFFHPSSYGGSELGAAVVEAVVDELTKPGFLDHVQAMGARLEHGLERLCERHPNMLTGRRGVGLMQALDTQSSATCYELMLATIRNGVLAIWANNRQETLLVMPPLVVNEADVDEIVEGIGGAAAAVDAATPAR
jgi:acetylornithine/succinyldiaminopimelate/putrescine aminotransferase